MNCKSDPVNLAQMVSQELTCSLCKARVESAEAMATHMRAYHHFECNCCAFVATNEDELLRHKEDNHIKCPDCGLCVKDGSVNAVPPARYVGPPNHPLSTTLASLEVAVYPECLLTCCG